MFTIGIGVFVGIGILAFRIYEVHKSKVIIEDVVSQGKYESITLKTKYPWLISACIILSIVTTYLGWINQSEENVGIGACLIFLFIAELIYNQFISKLYYTKDGVVIDNKYVRYKSMDHIKPSSKLPLAKCFVYTYRSEKIPVTSQTAKFIHEHGNIKYQANKRN